MLPCRLSEPRPKARIVNSHYKPNERRPGTPAMPPASRGRSADSLWMTDERICFDDADYSVVVMSRAPPPNSWRWEIYRAGKSSPIGRSRWSFLHHGPPAAHTGRCSY
jgi:hypothetical protein